MHRLKIREFLERSREVPVADVRSPGEFAHGHIPGAFNLPLFDNEERALVGTIYNMTGREKAIDKGLEIVGPHLKEYVALARQKMVNDELLIHCWRGGMRSESMAWLMETAGIRTSVLEGGYKSFRHSILEELDKDRRMIVIGGMTGSGKTEILREIGRMGYAVTDLESLAHHRGSVFGGMGQEEQPTQEQFENDLGTALRNQGSLVPAFIEDESIHIGKISIPKPFYTRLKQAPMIYVDVDRTTRAKRIIDEYACFDRDFLVSVTGQLARRMGGDRTTKAISLISEGKIYEAILLLLEYYDKTYLHALSGHNAGQVHKLELKAGNVHDHALQVIEKANHSGLLS